MGFICDVYSCVKTEHENTQPVSYSSKKTYFGVFYAMSLHSGMMLKIYSAHLQGMIFRDRFATIRKLYKGTRARVHSPDGETDCFKTLAWMLQGDTHALHIFSTVSLWLITICICHFEKMLQGLDNTQAIEVKNWTGFYKWPSSCTWQEKEMLTILKSKAVKVGLRLNVSKRLIATLNLDTLVNINSRIMKAVEDVNNLGS